MNSPLGRLLEWDRRTVATWAFVAHFMAWKRSRVQFPLAPRDAAGQRPAVLSFSVPTLSGSNAGSNARAPAPIVNSTLSEEEGVGDIRQLPLVR